MRGLIAGRSGTEDKCPRDYSYPDLRCCCEKEPASGIISLPV